MAYLIKRGRVYYIKHYDSGKKSRISTGTYQIAKEKLRRFEEIGALQGAVAEGDLLAQ